MSTKYTGCDELREWLVAQGFTAGNYSYKHRENQCLWYAWRRTEVAHCCEANDGKPQQLVVQPFEMDGHGNHEVEIRGEVNGLWFKLAVYSLSDEDLCDRLPAIERSLVAAWNALKENQ